MRSQKQIEASRANGSKSHGRKPGTSNKPVDTAISLDLLASTIVLPGESRKRFDFLHETLTKDLMPNGAIEKLLVDKMTVAHWRQMRLSGTEKANHLTDQASDPSIFAPYESDYDRQFTRALDQLIKIREARATAAVRPRVPPRSL